MSQEEAESTPQVTLSGNESPPTRESEDWNADEVLRLVALIRELRAQLRDAREDLQLAIDRLCGPL